MLEILFSGDSAKEPVLTSVARHFDIDINVLAGSVETLGGQQFGHLRVQLAENADVDAVLRYLHDRGIARSCAPAPPRTRISGLTAGLRLGTRCRT